VVPPFSLNIQATWAAEVTKGDGKRESISHEKTVSVKQHSNAKVNKTDRELLQLSIGRGEEEGQTKKVGQGVWKPTQTVQGKDVASEDSTTQKN